MFTLNKSLEDPNTFLESSVEFDHVFNKSPATISIKKSPKPFSTSKLQQAANNTLHFSPKDTMSICQKLYEEGYITYMRTDSCTYSKEFIESGKKYITTEWGDNYIKNNYKDLIHTDSKAHEAIRPTNINNVVIPLTGKFKSMYNLIWKNTCESMMMDAKFSVIKCKITAPLNYYYSYQCEEPIFLGWMVISYKNSSFYNYINLLTNNKIISYNKILAKLKIENNITHYSEAKLINLLEDKGIGRPSTYSGIVEKIKERGYVKKQNLAGQKVSQLEYELKDDEIMEIEVNKQLGEEKNKLVIQPLGIMVIEFLLQHYDNIFSYEYTKLMEKDLDIIAEGEMKWHVLCDNCYRDIMSKSKDIKEEKVVYKIDDNHTYMIGKYGPTVKYERDDIISFKKVNHDIDYFRLKNGEYTLDEIIDRTSDQTIGLYKNRPIDLRKGPYGYYIEYDGKKKSIGDKRIITLEDAIVLLEKPSTIVYELRDDLSIRNGKFGEYIFHKTKKMKKPKFYKLKGYDLNNYDKEKLLMWIKEKYHI